MWRYTPWRHTPRRYNQRRHIPRRYMSQRYAPRRYNPRKYAPQRYNPRRHTSPHRGTFHEGTPHGGTFHGGTPHRGTFHEGTPHGGTSHRGTPHGPYWLSVQYGHGPEHTPIPPGATAAATESFPGRPHLGRLLQGPLAGSLACGLASSPARGRAGSRAPSPPSCSCVPSHGVSLVPAVRARPTAHPDLLCQGPASKAVTFWYARGVQSSVRGFHACTRASTLEHTHTHTYTLCPHMYAHTYLYVARISNTETDCTHS